MLAGLGTGASAPLLSATRRAATDKQAKAARARSFFPGNLVLAGIAVMFLLFMVIVGRVRKMVRGDGIEPPTNWV